jgi:hypothetical protein
MEQGTTEHQLSLVTVEKVWYVTCRNNLTLIKRLQKNMAVMLHHFVMFFSNPVKEPQCVDLYSHWSQQD